jgi:DNA-binding MarR family transcriptional regulator
MRRTSKEPTQVRTVASEACSRRILETVPIVMRVLRREMRGGAEASLSVPQFRVLAYLSGAPGASLSEVADFVGVTGATASAMVDRLVRRGLVAREGNPEERRRLRLELTNDGSKLLERARAHTRGRVAESLTVLTLPELGTIVEGLDLLDRALGASTGPPEQP